VHREIWKAIEGHPNYQVSNLGRVKRLEIVEANNKTRACRLPERIMKGSFSKAAGWFVYLPGSNKQQIIARLVLTAFVRPPFEGEFARHLDDDKQNQNLINLAWGTRRDNGSDAVKNKRYNSAKGSKSGRSKLTEEQVCEIRNLHYSHSTNDLAKRYNVNPTTIGHIVSGSTWKHV
jgi:hypothetical protein